MITELRPVENGRCQDMLFLMYDNPSGMDSDARVDFVYTPTYIAATIMMTAACRYPFIREDEQFRNTLRAVLNASMGRDFMGAGYDDYSGLLDTLHIFATGDTVRFIEEYPEINEAFALKVRSAVTFVQTDICSGKVTDSWSGMDYSERGKQVLEMLGEVPDIQQEYVWYACYGSNLNAERFMRYIDRCTDTSAPVEDRPFRIPYKIYFAKTAKNWDNGGKAFLDDTADGFAYGRIYKITRNQYEQIRRFEGPDYAKQIELGMTDGLPVYTFTDTQRNADIHMPSAAYFSIILSGLQECYNGLVDEEILVQYLINAIMPADTYTVAKAIRQNDHYLTNARIAEKTGLAISDAVAAAEWLTTHHVIRQDSRSVRAGHGIDAPDAYFYTSDTPCARALIDEMIKAFQTIPERDADVDEEETISGGREGARHFTFASRIERNSRNRIEAIRLHGYTCQACGFNFEKTYGTLGRNYIEVHHVNPLAEQGEGIVNPETDLVCLCANCHRMVHRNRHEVLQVEELRHILSRNKSN